MPIPIKKRDVIEENWNILFEQIVKGNVIPVIGPEFVELGNVPSTQKIIDAFAESCEISPGEMNTFSQLVHDPRYLHEYKDNDIHTLVNDNITEIVSQSASQDDNSLLRRFLSIKYFPFVITTVCDPILENIMKGIHGENLRVMYFRNNPKKNDDIFNSEETQRPTLYYMFGKADGESNSFVLTDTDLLKFSRSWLLPTDSGSNAKPPVLSNLLSKRYLLVVGYNYQDWLFRFFWYAMKSDAFGKENSGMLAQRNNDQSLVDFLTRAKAFTQVEPDMERFVGKIEEGVKRAEATLGPDETIHSPVGELLGGPAVGTDVFISYSRKDEELVRRLYEILTSKGLKVWYDREKSLLPGVDFMPQIEMGIKNCTFFVPVFTNTIIAQAHERHPYRLEWKCAVEHINEIGGVSYCFPIFSDDFNMDSILAKIPPELKRCHGYGFNKANFEQRANELADALVCEKERRSNG